MVGVGAMLLLAALAFFFFLLLLLRGGEGVASPVRGTCARTTTDQNDFRSLVKMTPPAFSFPRRMEVWDSVRDSPKRLGSAPYGSCCAYHGRLVVRPSSCSAGRRGNAAALGGTTKSNHASACRREKARAAKGGNAWRRDRGCPMPHRDEWQERRGRGVGGCLSTIRVSFRQCVVVDCLSFVGAGGCDKERRSARRNNGKHETGWAGLAVKCRSQWGRH
jgi:hypothetical protein